MIRPFSNNTPQSPSSVPSAETEDRWASRRAAVERIKARRGAIREKLTKAASVAGPILSRILANMPSLGAKAAAGVLDVISDKMTELVKTGAVEPDAELEVNMADLEALVKELEKLDLSMLEEGADPLPPRMDGPG